MRLRSFVLPLLLAMTSLSSLRADDLSDLAARFKCPVAGDPASFAAKARAQIGAMKTAVKGLSSSSEVPVQPNAGTCSFTETSCGRTESGSLGYPDCTLDSDGTYLDFWTFNGTAGQTVTVTMRSTAFDSYLVLLDPTPNVVAEDDDSGGGYDARIQFTLTSSGVWGIAANQVEPRSGAYTLSISCSGTTDPPPSGDCTPGSLSCGQTRSGSVMTTDCRSGDLYADGYIFRGAPNQRVVITMRSTVFDALLALADPSGTIVRIDEDGAGGTDARIDYVLPTGGDWIVVAGRESGGFGSYTIEMACPTTQPPPTCSPCVPNSTTACLLANRFKVTLPAWKDYGANLSGEGKIVTYAENKEEVNPQYGPMSGAAFFSMYAWAPSSIEVLVRIIRGQNQNNKFWVFATGFTGAEYTLRVEDTQQCRVWQRTIPAGATSAVKDFDAFPFP